MKIEHVAIWCNDIESMKNFYCSYFFGTSNFKYANHEKQFESYFIHFDSGARLELMHKPNLTKPGDDRLGIIHLAFSVGSVDEVDRITERMIKDGYTCLSKPRNTGDGYYESVMKDPEGNLIELTE
jgi:lactoylglutathione lyase